MIITSVEKLKNPRRYRIVFDSGVEIRVHEDTMIAHRLLKGEDIIPEQLERIMEDEEQQRVYRSALEYLSRRPRSSKEVYDKLLSAGSDERLVTATIERLKEQGYIDDRQFAKMWVEHRLSSQSKGRKWVHYELLQKGMSKEHIQYALAQISDTEESAGAYRMLQKKRPSLKGEKKLIKQKLIAFLARRGFSGSAIQKAIRQWNEEHTEDPL